MASAPLLGNNFDLSTTLAVATSGDIFSSKPNAVVGAVRPPTSTSTSTTSASSSAAARRNSGRAGAGGAAERFGGGGEGFDFAAEVALAIRQVEPLGVGKSSSRSSLLSLSPREEGKTKNKREEEEAAREEELEATKKEKSRLVDQVARLNDTIAQLRAEVQQGANERAVFTERIQELKDESECRRKTAEDANVRAAAAESLVEELTSELDETKKERDGLKDAVVAGGREFRQMRWKLLDERASSMAANDNNDDDEPRMMTRRASLANIERPSAYARHRSSPAAATMIGTLRTNEGGGGMRRNDSETTFHGGNLYNVFEKLPSLSRTSHRRSSAPDLVRLGRAGSISGGRNDGWTAAASASRRGGGGGKSRRAPPEPNNVGKKNPFLTGEIPSFEVPTTTASRRGSTRAASSPPANDDESAPRSNENASSAPTNHADEDRAIGALEAFLAVERSYRTEGDDARDDDDSSSINSSSSSSSSSSCSWLP